MMLLATAWLIAVTASAAAPHLEKHGSTQQLRVHDKPFLILGGELGNSSASNAGYMQPHWPRLKAMHLNTVLAPVYWELVEPVEGRYDWASVDALLRDARAHELKLPIARERGATADKLFAGPVPAELMQSLARAQKLEPELRERWQKNGSKTSGSWAQVFVDDEWGQEVFTAWHYARFVEVLVKSGKQRYDLPMYVNAALNRAGRKPGEYPSGGPLPHLLDVWKAGAPSLDFLAPDIYFPNFSQLAARYQRADSLLFIPEANNATNPQGPANAFYSFRELDSLGFSPFSIESLGDAPNALSQSYEVFEQLTPLILGGRGRASMAGFRAQIMEDGTVSDTSAKTTIAGFEFSVTFIDPWTPRDEQTIANHGGMLIHAGGEDFWFAGSGLTVTFRGAGDGPPLAGIDFAEEGVFDARGIWQPGRRLNGDQTHQGRHIRLPPGKPQIQRVRLYRYR